MSNHALQEPLDGTVGGALDPNHDDDINLGGEIDPADVEGIDKDAGQPVSIQENAETEKVVRECVDKINDMKQQRLSLNADIKSMTEKVVSKGINKDAFKMVLKYMDMDETQRAGFDYSYNYARKILGEPVQADMFTDTESES